MLTSRTYPPDLSFGTAYEEVRQFLLRLNRDTLRTPYYTWPAWEWAFALRYHSEEDVSTYRLWDRAGEMVGIALNDEEPSDWYLYSDPLDLDLKRRMIEEILANHNDETHVRLCASDADPAFQRLLRDLDFRPTGDKEATSTIDLTGALDYALPSGYSIIDNVAGFDLYNFNRCLWSGFNREGEPDTSDSRLDFRRRQLSSPNQVPALCIMVVAPNGDYAAYCGMWHEPGTFYAYVEPVCTHATYRKLGLGKAAVLEACRRCAARGAQIATVYSSQQFYYNIGFNPLPAERWWTHGRVEG